MLKSLMVRMNDRTIVTISTCLSPGSVTCRKRCQAPAPSTEAASYSSRGIACIPARYDTPKNGNARHQLATITAAMAPAGVAMKAMGRRMSPASSSTLLKKPRPGKASNIQPGERDDHRGGDPRQQEQAAEEVASAPDT